MEKIKANPDAPKIGIGKKRAMTPEQQKTHNNIVKSKKTGNATENAKKKGNGTAPKTSVQNLIKNKEASIINHRKKQNAAKKTAKAHVPVPVPKIIPSVEKPVATVEKLATNSVAEVLKTSSLVNQITRVKPPSALLLEKNTKPKELTLNNLFEGKLNNLTTQKPALIPNTSSFNVKPNTRSPSQKKINSIQKKLDNLLKDDVGGVPKPGERFYEDRQKKYTRLQEILAREKKQLAKEEGGTAVSKPKVKGSTGGTGGTPSTVGQPKDTGGTGEVGNSGPPKENTQAGTNAPMSKELGRLTEQQKSINAKTQSLLHKKQSAMLELSESQKQKTLVREKKEAKKARGIKRNEHGRPIKTWLQKIGLAAVFSQDKDGKKEIQVEREAKQLEAKFNKEIKKSKEESNIQAKVIETTAKKEVKTQELAEYIKGKTGENISALPKGAANFLKKTHKKEFGKEKKNTKKTAKQEIEDEKVAAKEAEKQKVSDLIARFDPKAAAKGPAPITPRTPTGILLKSGTGQYTGSTAELAPGSSVDPYKKRETIGPDGNPIEIVSK